MQYDRAAVRRSVAAAVPPLTKALAIENPIHAQAPADVRAARRLATATAQEGVAAADLYPRITLTGFLGLLAGRGNLFNVSDTRAWAVTPALSWAAFDLGSARARLRGVEGVTREAMAEFEQAVLRALEETENALVNYREEQLRLVKLTGRRVRVHVPRRLPASGIAKGPFTSSRVRRRTHRVQRGRRGGAEAGVFTSVIALLKHWAAYRVS